MGIVLANLSVSAFGPSSTIINAFLFIGLDLTARDKLHEAWRGRWLWPKMFVLIACGSLVSWVLNRNVGPIALASLLAFLGASIVDACVYHIVRKRSWIVKSNFSNILSALADSLIFPAVAFGSFLPLIVLGQFVAKVFGGFLWSLLIHRLAYRVQTGKAAEHRSEQAR